MSTGLQLTLDELDEMVARGAFAALQPRRFELINGELREMAPIGPDHADATDWVMEWSIHLPVKSKVRVRIQQPIRIEERDSQPQPDVVWAALKKYTHHPTPKDIYLVIEVADETVKFDCGEKADLYAAGGIKDYWVVNLPDRTIEVFRKPKGDHYQQRRTYGVGEKVSPLAFPQVELKIRDLFTLATFFGK
jgi:Uma2 family endonuclease